MHCLGEHLGDPLHELPAGVGSIGASIDSERHPQERFGHRIGSKPVVRLAPSEPEQHVRVLPNDLQCEPALADAWFAGDDHHRTPTLAGRCGTVEQEIDLVRPTTQLGVGTVEVASTAEDPPETAGVDGHALALGHERLERLVLHLRAGPVDDRPCRHDLARSGLGHQACGEVHVITHDRVRPPGRRPEISGERVAPVHARPEVQAGVGIDQIADRTEHSVLVTTT